MFAGQGSHSSRPERLTGSDDLLELAKSRLGIDLSKQPPSVAGPFQLEGNLIQPWVYTAAVAGAQRLTKQGFRPSAVAGHSLGEYAALVAAGAIDYVDGLALVVERERLMLQVSRRQPSGMAAVVGLPVEVTAQICDAIPEVWLACDNSSTQAVISGLDKALAHAARDALAAGAKRVVRLRIPAACHSPLMTEVATRLGSLLEITAVKSPAVSWSSGVDASVHSEPGDIRKLLIDALTTKVQFRGVLRQMYLGGVRAFVEVGQRPVLTTFINAVSPDVSVLWAGGVLQGRDREVEVENVSG